MGENAGERDAGLGQGRRDGDELGIGGGQPAAMAVAVDLDEGGGRHAGGTRCRAQHRRLFRRIEQHLKVNAGFAETHRPFSGVRCHADGICHVTETVLREVLSLRQGGDRDRPRPGGIGALGNLDGFRGFHMGAQHDASRGHTRGQTGEIAIQPVFVEQEGRRRQCADRRGYLAWRGVLAIRPAHIGALHLKVS